MIHRATEASMLNPIALERRLPTEENAMEDEFTTADRRVVSIHIDDEDDYKVTVKTADGRLIGNIEFTEIDMPDNEMNILKMRWAYLDQLGGSYLRQGIGRRCLELVKAFSSLGIIAAANDGQQQEDGSHLTGDAPGFVAKMRREGVIGSW